MTEKPRFPQDSRLYLGTTSNPLLVERSVLLSVYLTKESIKYLGPIRWYAALRKAKKDHTLFDKKDTYCNVIPW